MTLSNPDLERSVLAVVLDGRHRSSMATARTWLPHPIAFDDRDHRLVYLACLQIDDQAQHVDSAVVANLLQRWRFHEAMAALRLVHEEQEGVDARDRVRLRALYRVREEEVNYDDSVLAQIGGRSTLEEIAIAFAPVAGFERNCQLVADLYAKRRLLMALDRAREETLGVGSASEVVDKVSRRLLTCTSQSSDELVHVSVGFDEMKAELAKQHVSGTPLGLGGKLDGYFFTGGLRQGGLYVLAARPGAGKTSCALSIVASVAATRPCLFYSLEVDRSDLALKLTSARTGIPFDRLERGGLVGAEQEQVDAVIEEARGWNMTVCDLSDVTVQRVRSTVRRQCLAGQPPALVVVDYLQLLGGSSQDQTEYEKISEITRTLKILAREAKVPVLALSQMSRDSEKGQGNEPRAPRLSDLRGSGTIEQDADAVLFLHQTGKSGEGESETRKIKVVVAKSRFGPTGECDYLFRPASMAFLPENKVKPEVKRESPPETRQDRMEGPPSDAEDLF